MLTTCSSIGIAHVPTFQTSFFRKTLLSKLKGSKPNFKSFKVSCSKENSSEKCNKFVSKRTLLGLTSTAAVLAAVESASISTAQAEPIFVPLKISNVSDSPPLSCENVSRVQLSILGSSVLGVSVYPDFVYNPLDGGSLGTAVDLGNGIVQIKFDPNAVYIPAVQSSSTSLLGVPIPPSIRIDIVPETLEGFLDRNSGEVKLNFKAKFNFSVGPFYKAPPLLVDTVLTTEFSQGVTRKAQGQRMDSSGRCRLVGTARVPPVDDVFLTNFLLLPADVVAELPAQFQFVTDRGSLCPIKVVGA